MIQQPQRIFSPREQTHLARFSADPLQKTTSTAPVEYLTGKAEFYDFVLDVNDSVLIPRIETEELVASIMKAISEKLASNSVKLRVLEVGTGSGAITIALAKQLEAKWSQLQFVAADISQSALTLAQKNCEQLLGTAAPVTFVKSNLLTNIQSQTFDIIVANLPYIPSSRIATLDEGVKDHEPLLALDGGLDGFALIARLLDTAPAVLAENAQIFLELDHTHSLKNFEPYSKLGWQVALSRDQAGHTRFAQLSLPV
ncbi:MAG: peptide chain release factor N(5)-glutamine methyltransferase [bacterium]|nr:peptide chain release factor N(5)-glutamine methyltransferase [bacterium]